MTLDAADEVVDGYSGGCLFETVVFFVVFESSQVTVVADILSTPETAIFLLGFVIVLAVAEIAPRHDTLLRMWREKIDLEVFHGVLLRPFLSARTALLSLFLLKRVSYILEEI